MDLFRIPVAGEPNLTMEVPRDEHGAFPKQLYDGRGELEFELRGDTYYRVEPPAVGT